SIRKYRPDPVPPEALARVLQAASLAPSGNNSQPWRFVVVTDAGIKKKLCEVSGNQEWIVEAPVTVAVVGDITAKIKEPLKPGATPSTEDPKHRAVLLKTLRDATIAADHLVLAAEDEGLGSCWIALFEQEDIKPVLAVPENCYVVALVTIGFAAETPKHKPRLPLRETVFRDRYGRRFDESELPCS
ncbi:MAG TPA: nitroreductase family protein, partial [bacterium]|nr:nitroreductase family protein [bacterium]